MSHLFIRHQYDDCKMLKTIYQSRISSIEDAIYHADVLGPFLNALYGFS
jgi:hypothetical protein